MPQDNTINLETVHANDRLSLSGPGRWQGDFAVTVFDTETGGEGTVWISRDEARRLFGWLGVRLHT